MTEFRHCKKHGANYHESTFCLQCCDEEQDSRLATLWAFNTVYAFVAGIFIGWVIWG